jgi:hypothetical protein
MWLLYSPAPSNDGPVRGDELWRAAAGFTCGSVVFGLMVMSYFGRVAGPH